MSGHKVNIQPPGFDASALRSSDALGIGPLTGWSPQASWVVGLTLLLVFGQVLPAAKFFDWPSSYLPLHIFLEFIAIAIAAMVFGLAWNLRNQGANNHSIILGVGFLAVALIDFAHTLSYAGMPALVTPSDPEKAINFWLAGRFVAAATLIAVAVLPPRRWSSGQTYAALAAASGLVILVWWVGLNHADWLPRTFVAGEGLTGFKIGTEYLFAGTYGTAAVLLYLNSRRSRNKDLLWLAAAAWVQGLAEMFFTLYVDVTDVFNLLGHVYKAIAYVMVYRALFVSGVQLPYRELNFERARLEAVIATIPDPIWLKDPDGVYLHCNPEFERFCGANEIDIIGKTDYDFVTAELADFFRRNDRAAMDAGKPTVNEEWLTFAADGYHGLFQTTKAPMYSSEGQIIGVLGIAHDITQLRADQDELRRHRKELERLVEERTANLLQVNTQLSKTMFAMDGVGIGISWANCETGRFEYANRFMAEFLGYTVEELLKIGVSDIDPNFPSKDFLEFVEEIRAAGHIRLETTQKRKDGTIVPVEMTIYFHEGKSESPPVLIAFMVDIGERKQNEAILVRARQAAEAATAAKSGFLANMSHEIRTPLNAIVGMAHLIRRHGLEAEQAERLDKLEAAGEHLLSVISAILELSKIEAGKFVLEEGPVNLERLTTNVASIIRERASTKRLALKTELKDIPDDLLGDGTRIQQALLNYAANAVKFTESGSINLHVTLVEETASDAVVRFEVQDTGIGISPEILPRLFTTFEQADNSTTRKYGGTGLGLSITRRIAQLMDGDAGADSTPGAGSTFWFTARLRKGQALQVDSAVVRGESAEVVLKRDFAGARILLAEDEPVNREIARFILGDVAFQVDLAEDGSQALKLASQNDYALILMDMQMPIMDGLDATRNIRKMPRGGVVPILAMTANAFAEDRTRCLDAGMNDFITKPVTPNRFYEIVLKWLSRDKATHQLAASLSGDQRRI